MPDSTAIAESEISKSVENALAASSISAPTGATIPDPDSVEEFGRTWNGYRQDKYLLPNDAAEQERLDFQHIVWDLIMDGHLSWAPLDEETADVLDIGTGTGIWAIQFAEKYPTTRVVGTDLSLIQPSSIPPNCIFFREDAEDQWVFDHGFDYVHLRAMCTCFSDGKEIMRKIFDNLRPGGWVEYQDFRMRIVDENYEEGAAVRETEMYKSNELCVEGAAALGHDLRAAQKYKTWLTEVGFVDVVERVIPVPINPWPEDPKAKLLGQVMEANGLRLAEGFNLKILQATSMSVDEIRDFLPSVRKSLTDRNNHAYAEVCVVYGRKP